MSPPEIWGPPIWILFHTLVENVNENHKNIFPQLFGYIKRICVYLPCPECSKDATIFLGKIKSESLLTKNDLINTMYIFHNYVNSKKKKNLFNYGNINIYKTKNLFDVLNNFAKVYNTTGNMKLLAESFQRKLILTDFKKWFNKNIKSFVNIPLGKV